MAAAEPNGRQILEVSVFDAIGLPTSTGAYYVRLSVYVSGKTFIKSELAKESAEKKESVQERGRHKFEGEKFVFFDKFEYGNVPVSLFVELVEKKVTFASLYPTTKVIGMTEIKLPMGPNPTVANAIPETYSLEPSKVKAAGKSPINAKRALASEQLGKIKLTLNWKTAAEGSVGGATGEVGNLSPFDIEALGVKLPDEDANPAADEIPDFEPNMLIVRVISADELRVMDKSWAGGSSDPRVKIKLDGSDANTWARKKKIDGIATVKQKVRTSTIKQNLQPVWNETFMIPCLAHRDGTPPNIEFIVEDEDSGLAMKSYQFMGKCSIDLRSILRSPQVNSLGQSKFMLNADREKVKLLNNKGFSDLKRGYLSVAMQWVHDADQAKLDETERNKSKGFFNALNVFAEEESDIEDGDPDDEVEKTAAELNEEREAAKLAKAEQQEMLGNITVNDGDYQVQVHIIECRELKAMDDGGTSDPIVYVSCFGQKQCTPVKEKQLSPVFDELFIFEKRDLDKEQFDEESVQIQVMDVDLLSSNDLIGDYTCDLSYVYFRENHEIYRTWVGLVNDEDPAAIAITGYVKISIQVVGPEDKLFVHDEAEEKRKEKQAEKEAGGAMTGAVMMPPSIQREVVWLKTTIYRCEYLPMTDDGFTASARGIDAYVSVQHGTNPPLKTKTITCKGADRTQLKPSFNTELWLPVTMPTSSQNIKVTVMDHETVGSDEVVATTYHKFGELKAMGDKKGPFWQPLYGAAVDVPTIYKMVNQAANLAAKINYVDYYNKFPESASTYRGRVLMKQEILTKHEAPDKDEVAQAKQWKRRVKANKLVDPPTTDYVLSCVILSGTELPQSKTTGFSSNKKMQVRISCGKYVMYSKRVDNNKGVSRWDALMENSDELMVYPEDAAQIPDIFIHLCKGEEGSTTNPFVPMSFARIPAEELKLKKFDLSKDKKNSEEAHYPHWVTLMEDKSLDCLPDGQFPGNLLMMIGLGTREEWRAQHEAWDGLRRQAEDMKTYHLRCNIYQARDLPDADLGGGIDPYFKINYWGKEQKTEHTDNNNDPLVYKTKCFDDVTHSSEFMPQVCCQVWDHDDVGADDYIGLFFHEFTEEERANADTIYGTEEMNEPPTPRWYDLMQEEEGDMTGQVLASFQLIRKMPHASIPMTLADGLPDIVPEFREACLEILCIGVRDMAPYAFMPMQHPKLEFSVEYARVGEPDKNGEVDIIIEPQKLETKNSKKPTASDANFLELLELEVLLPDDPLFAPALKITAIDERLGGFLKPVVGTGIVSLEKKCFWGEEYEPINMEFFDIDAGNAEDNEDAGDSNREMTEEEQEAANQKRAEAILKSQNRSQNARASLASMAALDEEEESKADGATIKGKTAAVATEHTDLSTKAEFRDVFRAEDTGTGILGALKSVEQADRAERLKRQADLDSDDDLDLDLEEEDSDEDVPKYLKDRTRHKCELEDKDDGLLKGTPFENYELSLGSKIGDEFMDPDWRVVGKVKGLIRVKESMAEAPLFEKDLILKPQGIVLRVYMLDASNLAAKDMSFDGTPGKSDPYLTVELGHKHKYNGRKEHFDDCTECDFHKMVEFHCEIPGASQLVVKVWDYDFIGTDDLIGETKIDIEDRWFDMRWKKMGREKRCSEFAEGIRWDVKPLENRQLRVQGTTLKQGALNMWIDMLKPNEANAFPPDDISLPPTLPCEARLVVYKAKDLVAMDVVEQMNDAYVTCWFEGFDKQHTDTHWRSKKGKASWNYRKKWNLDLSARAQIVKFPYVHLQCWDQDIIGEDDLIAEVVIDIEKELRRVMKKLIPVEKFKDPPKAAELLEDSSSESEGEVDDDDDDDDDKKALLPAGGDSSAVEMQPVEAKEVDEDDMEGDKEDEEENKPTEPLVIKKKKPKKEKKDSCYMWCCKSICCCCLGCRGICAYCPCAMCCQFWPCCWPLPTKAGEGEEEGQEDIDEDAAEMINTIKDLMGNGDSKPRDSTWLFLEKYDHESGQQEPMGKLCVGLWIGPKADADAKPAGFGRNDPNANPYLPPPTGRMKFSLNPFVMGAELCGPKICAQITCCLLCVAGIAVMLFCGPVFNFITAFLLAQI